MKRLLIAIILAATATAAYAACTTQTIMLPDGRTMFCSVCCDQNGNCSTICV